MTARNENLENKSLPQAPEDKADKPAAPQAKAPKMVDVTASLPIAAGRLGNDKDLRPGDKFKLPAGAVNRYVAQGAIRVTG